MENMIWRKSSYSGNGGADCVELARTSNGVAARDSKAPRDGLLRFAAAEWRAFTARVRAGDYDPR